jgi:high affinity Mn2+ porin
MGALLLLILSASLAWAADPESATTPQQTEDFGFHGQFTNVTQFHPRFRSPYRGPNSLDPGNRGNEALSLTLYGGFRPWEGAELWANPEVDQGFGLSNTTGLAGYANGQSAKVGSAEPYVRLQRVFLRQTIGLGGDSEDIHPDLNQLGGTRRTDNVVLTIGKFSVTDIFDANSYAHDPLGDFLNWSMVDAGAFDYAADAWGYAYGAAAEWNQSWWTLRGGLFDLSRVPNQKALERGFGQFQIDLEGEERHHLFGRSGKLKLLAFVSRGRFGSYNDAVSRAITTGATPDTATVRRYRSRPGLSLNFEQEVSDGLGVFARASVNDGSLEADEFTDINRSLSAGVSMKGASWSRPDDTVGLAGAVNGISKDARRYFAAGGIGILVGDGRLPHYGWEDVLETYYNVAIAEWLRLSIDYQFVNNPAYNRDRGPVSIVGYRLHCEF